MKEYVVSKCKYNNNSARKVRLVANLIRNKYALDGVSILKFTNKAAARDVAKVLNSAISNAVHNKGWKKEDLLIEKILIDDAPAFKRGRAAARGRYHRILKRNCHITVYLKTEPKIKINTEKKAKTKIKKITKSELNK